MTSLPSGTHDLGRLAVGSLSSALGLHQQGGLSTFWGSQGQVPLGMMIALPLSSQASFWFDESEVFA